MTTTEKEIEGLAISIWATLFDPGLALTRRTDVLPDALAVSGIVHVNGAWRGAVLLQCSAPLAQRLTAALFQSAGPHDAEDLRDTVGELTNMLAGNVKALLPSPSAISLPTVAFGSDYALMVVGTTALATVVFDCAGEPLVVSLLQGPGEDPRVVGAAESASPERSVTP